MSKTIEEYLIGDSHLVHILELIREKEGWGDEEIVQSLLKLFKEKRITFAYHGSSTIFGHVISIPEGEWKNIKPGSLYYSFLKVNYAWGIKKVEIERIRKLMRLIMKEIYGEEYGITGYSNPLEWCYIVKELLLWNKVKTV